MDLESVFTISDYIEFVVVGAHTSAWLLVIGAFVLDKPLSSLMSLSPLLVLPALPFLYIVGLMFDSLSQFVLNPLRILIRNQTFNPKGDYLDEYIALHSPTLYTAYDWKLRRVRIPTSAVFNWLLLGLGLSMHFGFSDSYRAGVIIATSVGFSAVSLFAWVQLFRRAYGFRKTACEVIRGSLIPPGKGEHSSD